jgi:hypothetical protein
LLNDNSRREESREEVVKRGSKAHLEIGKAHDTPEIV